MNGSMDRTFLVKSEGILHGIPILSESAKNLRAIVVGASGTSGQPLLEVLSSNSERWEKVYALSRKPPRTSRASNVEHVPVDLLWDPENISALLVQHRVRAEYIFYFGYAQVAQSKEAESAVFGDAEQLADLNRRLLENFLTALDQASVQPKRIILQTGGKNYGVHQGHVNVPLTEGAPRVELEPNFYYAQEDSLVQYCKSHTGVGYNVTMPQWILSAVANTNMTIFYPLAVYASIQRKLDKPLLYPGDLKSWDNDHPISTGLLMGKFYEWLVLTPETSGESFNFTDGSEFTFGKLWPILASWFDLQWLPPEEDAVYHEIQTPFTPRGYGPKGTLRSSFNLIEWAKAPATRQAWADLTREHGLVTDPLGDAESTFTFLQFAIELTWSWATSMDKARKYGWFGHCNSIESMRVVFERFEVMKMIPPLRK